jgi:predicted PhzF superfamily epimerase YddE/YHI9
MFAGQVDAFTDVAFRGNPAAVCLLDGGARIHDADRKWMLAVAAEFNAPVTAFLAAATADRVTTTTTPRFHIRWFTTVTEVHLQHSILLPFSWFTWWRPSSLSAVDHLSRLLLTSLLQVELCGHATLAAAHFLLTGGVVGTGSTTGAIEFAATMSGLVLTARWQVKAARANGAQADSATRGVDRGGFRIELDFPVASVQECASGDVPALPDDTLNGATVVNVCKTSTVGDLMVTSIASSIRNLSSSELEKVNGKAEREPVFLPCHDQIELSSAEEVARLHPNLAEIQECAKRAMIVTGPTPVGSQIDFVTRLFAPNLGVNEVLSANILTHDS